MARHIKTGDTVMVISGKSKGQQGKVLRVIASHSRVVVEGVNRVWKHVRPSQRNPQGGRILKDAPIHMSNVLPLDPTTNRGVRVRYEDREGVKRRIAVGSNADLGIVGKKPTPAK